MAKIGELAKSKYNGRMELKLKEDDEQFVVVEYLQLRGWEVHHSPNGGKRPSKIDAKGRTYSNEGKKMQKLGTLPGFPDLILLDPPPNFPASPGTFIEMKMIDGTASKEQKEFVERRLRQGWKACIAYGATHALDFLKSLGY
jgi:hypothetical protein